MSLRFCDNCELTAKVPGISDETSDGVKSFLEIVIRFCDLMTPSWFGTIESRIWLVDTQRFALGENLENWNPTF